MANIIDLQDAFESHHAAYIEARRGYRIIQASLVVSTIAALACVATGPWGVTMLVAPVLIELLRQYARDSVMTALWLRNEAADRLGQAERAEREAVYSRLIASGVFTRRGSYADRKAVS